MATRLSEVQINEVSFVDNPADPNAMVEFFKRDDTEDVDKGQPTGSQVIRSGKVRRKKIRPFRRNNEEDQEEEMEKGFVRRLAERMGFEVDDDASLEDIDNAFIESATMDIEEVIDTVGKALYDDDRDTEEKEGKMSEIDLSSVSPEVAAHIEKLEEDNKAVEAELELAKSSDEGDTDGDSDESDEDILKSADPAVVALIEKAQSEAASAQEIAKTERGLRLDREFLEKADSLPHVGGERQEVASLLKGLSENVDPDTFAKLEELLLAANTQIAEGELFKVAGMPGTVTAGDAYGQLEGIAKNLQEADSELTFEMAFDQAVTENPTLYERHQEEQEA